MQRFILNVSAQINKMRCLGAYLLKHAPRPVEPCLHFLFSQTVSPTEACPALLTGPSSRRLARSSGRDRRRRDVRVLLAGLISPLISANNASGLPARLSPDRGIQLPAGKTLAQALAQSIAIVRATGVHSEPQK